MSYYYRQAQFGPGVPGLFVRNVIIINVVVYLLGLFLGNFIVRDPMFYIWVFNHFGLNPAYFLSKLHIWQPVTYMFLHSYSSLSHIFFNMLMLWMFGTEVEQKMGSRRFGIFFLSSGAGAGILSYFFSLFCYSAHIINTLNVPTIGASGAIFGVMMAFALFYPNRLVLLFFVIPVRAYFMVMGMGLLQMLYLLRMPNGGVSYIAHLGGMLIAYLFLKYQWPVAGFIEEFADNRREEKIRAAKAKAIAEQERVDAILDKINRDGMHTLSREERKFLRERSNRRKR